MKDLFGNEYDPAALNVRVVDGEQRNKDGSRKSNPCLKLYGPGPEGMRCKHCVLLKRFERGKSWSKCELRRKVDGSWGSVSTDHRSNWMACGRFVAMDPPVGRKRLA